MRHPTKKAAIAVLALAVLSGCATVQVSGPAASTAVAPAETPRASAPGRFTAGARPQADADGYRPPLRLAVLLPQSGSLATAAGPVRDGLLSAYYGERRRRPELQFYDTAGTAEGAASAYGRALADGADQVLGPLGRDEVDAVFRVMRPEVPLVALNRPVSPAPPNAASYALAPEDEGIAAADFLAAREARRVLVLSNGDDTARRSIAAFDGQLRAQGGSIVQTLAVVGDKPADMTALLQGAAQREGGIDAVYLALRAPQARLLAAQLSAAGLAGKPRVATSQITSGSNAAQDVALDGIAFPADAWTAGGVSGLPDAARTGATLPTARGPAARLFAFGYDAWLISAYLERLASGRDDGMRSASGTLRIDDKGNVLRKPAWSTYSSGHAVPLAGSGG
ncbi:MAG TPA: penicillin-binding protein activator [Luteimonas sp.]|nr:penicillin-binding protein activator [Luteimonas sp.]